MHSEVILSNVEKMKGTKIEMEPETAMDAFARQSYTISMISCKRAHRSRSSYVCAQAVESDLDLGTLCEFPPNMCFGVLKKPHTQSQSIRPLPITMIKLICHIEYLNVYYILHGNFVYKC